MFEIPKVSSRSNYASAARTRRLSRRRRQVRRRRRLLLVLGCALAAALVVVVHGRLAGGDSFPAPSPASLAEMSATQRIVALAESQVGYDTEPASSYCNKFSSHWHAGTSNCPAGERAEEWCADFAAWAWQKAGIEFDYGYEQGEINGAAASFYEWGLAHDTWHPVGDGYVARPGDVAVYGLSEGPSPYAAHVALVVDDPPGAPGPNVVNGDGDQSGFSVVESADDQLQVRTAAHGSSSLAGYVSPA